MKRSISVVPSREITYVVMNVAVRDGNPLAGVGHIDQAVVVVLVVGQVTRQVNVVDPDIVGRLNSDGVAIFSEDLADLQVSQNDVGLPVDGQTDASDCCGRSLVSYATKAPLLLEWRCTYSCRTCR